MEFVRFKPITGERLQCVSCKRFIRGDSNGTILVYIRIYTETTPLAAGYVLCDECYSKEDNDGSPESTS